MSEIYPWNILEMSGEGNDERSVRQAYARKLKQCRPEEDPEGFQLLLQARNHALLLLKGMDIVHTDASVQTNSGDGQSVEEKHRIKGAGGCHAILADVGLETRNDKERFSRRYFENKLEEMNDPFLDIWELSYWHDFFDALNNANFHCRQDIEWLLIRQVGSRLFENACLADCHTSHDRPDQGNVQDVLFLMDEEFGWTENDQKIYRVLGRGDGDLFLTLIRSRVTKESCDGRETKTRAASIPYIALPDLRAFTGDSGEDIVQYYIAVRQSGQWGQGLDWSGFLLGYIWYAWRALWKASLGIILLQTVVIVLMVSIGASQPLLYGLVAGILAVLPLLFIARYGKYQVVHFAIDTIRNAENIPFGSSLERYHYLKRKGRGNVFFILFMVSVPFAIIYIIHLLKG